MCGVRRIIMRKAGLALAALLVLAGWGCGATTTRDNALISFEPRLTNASVTVMTRDDGKDEDSAIAVQILDDGRMAAEGTVVDVDYDDQSVSAPLNLAVSRTLDAGDLDDTQVRLRLTPDGRDTWVFDMRLTLGLSDGTQRSYFWSGIRLDDTSPERLMTLSSGRLP
jgi:hypothetical protein